MTRQLAWILVLAALVAPATGASLHHRRRAPPTPPPAQAAPAPFEFYPREIEGGVSGNLPFNNQIRKLKDPLNANGAGG